MASPGRNKLIQRCRGEKLLWWPYLRLCPGNKQVDNVQQLDDRSPSRFPDVLIPENQAYISCNCIAISSYHTLHSIQMKPIVLKYWKQTPWYGVRLSRPELFLFMKVRPENIIICTCNGLPLSLCPLLTNKYTLNYEVHWNTIWSSISYWIFFQNNSIATHTKGVQSINYIVGFMRCISIAYSLDILQCSWSIFCLRQDLVGISAYFAKTHWGQVTHINVTRLNIIGSNIGLSPIQCQTITWTSDDILTHIKASENIICEIVPILSLLQCNNHVTLHKAINFLMICIKLHLP